MFRRSCGSCRMTSDEKDVIIGLGKDVGIIVSHQSGYFVPDILTVTIKDPEIIKLKVSDYLEQSDTDFPMSSERAIELLQRLAKRTPKGPSQAE